MDDELYHIGIKGRSGRYPLGSGERPYQGYLAKRRRNSMIKKMSTAEIDERIQRIQKENKLKELEKTEKQKNVEEAISLIKSVAKTTLKSAIPAIAIPTLTYLVTTKLLKQNPSMNDVGEFLAKKFGVNSKLDVTKKVSDLVKATQPSPTNSVMNRSKKWAKNMMDAINNGTVKDINVDEMIKKLRGA